MADCKRILVIKLSALGDLFHAVPVVHELKNHFQCPVDWVTQPEYVNLVKCHRDVDRVIAYPRRGGVGACRAFLRELRAHRYDLVLDLQGLFKSGLSMGLAKGARKICPSSPREASHFFAHETPLSRANTPHAMDRLLDSLRHLDLEPGNAVYPLDFPPADPLPGTRPRLAIAPKSRWPGKDWPLESFIQCARGVRTQVDVDVVVLGGPDDHDAGEALVKGIGERAWNLCGQTPLIQLGSQLREVDCLLCNDSGPMHFAAAVGTPLVALFGPTDPAKTGPWGEGHTILRPPPGPGGYPDHRSYKRPGNAFISQIPIPDVVAAVAEKLAMNLEAPPRSETSPIP
ncbi:MAG: glycosyltransferase family 9 protein [Verrucomicrobia bacterium]|nr:glycosyltransferase family 9 protein [Verrucomicrobiota bacterium]MCH8511558.1 glycosyltransferase family 9 protein [Kiritimatiellia bacterium]